MRQVEKIFGRAEHHARAFIGSRLDWSWLAGTFATSAFCLTGAAIDFRAE
jgi:hypothetical protein